MCKKDISLFKISSSFAPVLMGLLFSFVFGMSFKASAVTTCFADPEEAPKYEFAAENDMEYISENGERLAPILEDMDASLSAKNAALETISVERDLEELEEGEEIAREGKIVFRSVLRGIESAAVEVGEVLGPIGDMVLVGTTIKDIVEVALDPNATSLDVSTAVLGWVPIVGDILRYFDGKQKTAGRAAEAKKRYLEALAKEKARREKHAVSIGHHIDKLNRLSHYSPGKIEELSIVEYYKTIVVYRNGYEKQLLQHWEKVVDELFVVYERKLYKELAGATISHADLFAKKGDLSDFYDTIYSQLQDKCDYSDINCFMSELDKEVNSNPLVKTLANEQRRYHPGLLGTIKLSIIDDFLSHVKEINKTYEGRFVTKLGSYRLRLENVLKSKAEADFRAEHKIDDEGFLLRSAFPDCWSLIPDGKVIRGSRYLYDHSCGRIRYIVRNDDFLLASIAQLRKLLFYNNDKLTLYPSRSLASRTVTVSGASVNAATYGQEKGYLESKFKNMLSLHPFDSIARYNSFATTGSTDNKIHINRLKDIHFDSEKFLKRRVFQAAFSKLFKQHKDAFHLVWYNASLAGVNVWVSKSYDGNIQCVSKDGLNCVSAERGVDINDETTFLKKLKPLVCGEDYKKKHGTTGFEDPRDWCSVVKRNFETIVQDADNGYKSKIVWYKGTLVNTDVWLSKNIESDIQCLSLDGTSCAFGEYMNIDVNEDADLLSKLEPLSCGIVYEFLHQKTGYDDPRHWCSVVKRNFETIVKDADNGYKKKIVWYRGTSIGLDVWLSKNIEGDMQCLSFDRTSCDWGGYMDVDINADPDLLSKLRPLSCGIVYEFLNHDTGYDDPSHWCSVAINNFEKIVDAGIGKFIWYKGTSIGLDVWFSENLEGDIQCLSKDGLDCGWGEYMDIDINEDPGLLSELQPLSCGIVNKKIGYDDPSHWCSIVRKHIQG